MFGIISIKPSCSQPVPDTTDRKFNPEHSNITWTKMSAQPLKAHKQLFQFVKYVYILDINAHLIQKAHCFIETLKVCCMFMFIQFFFYHKIDSSHGSKITCVLSAILLDLCSCFLQSSCVSCCLWKKLFLLDLVSNIIT